MSNGKGSNPRRVNKRIFDENFLAIDWGRKKKDESNLINKNPIIELSQLQFELLEEYIHSPLIEEIGKKWKSKEGNKWMQGEYFLGKDGTEVAWKEIKII